MKKKNSAKLKEFTNICDQQKCITYKIKELVSKEHKKEHRGHKK